jgi:transposase-like protein
MQVPAREKNLAVAQVLRGEKSVSSISRSLGVARKTVYAWVKSYKSAPSRLKSSALDNKYSSGQHHPKAISKEAKKALKRFVILNPKWGCRRYSEQLKKIGHEVSYIGVYDFLQRLGINTPELRENFRSNYSGPGRLSPEVKFHAVLDVVDGKKSIQEVASEYRVARKTIYEWINKYRSGIKEGLSGVEALKDSYLVGGDHPRTVAGKYEDQLLDLVVERPELSVHQLAGFFPISSWTIWKLLNKHGLAHYKYRLAYSHARGEEEVPSIRPELSWLDRLRLAWEQFLPSRAPAPPPGVPTVPFPAPFGAGLQRLRRFAPYILLSLLALTSLYQYGSLLGQTENIQQTIGYLFAGVSLSMGTVFFLYSLKYYFTLAIVLSFSREAGSDQVQNSTPEDHAKGQAGGQAKLKVKSSTKGWLGRIFNIGTRVQVGWEEYLI